MADTRKYTQSRWFRTSNETRSSQRQIAIIVILLVTGLGVLTADGAAQRSQSHTGHVVDLACYTLQGATSYAECDQRLTVKNGQPMGLLTDDGTLVLFVYPSRSIYTRLQDLVGRQVRVTGTPVTRGRLRVFSVENVWTDMRPNNYHDPA